jgi:UDP-glucose 4-epimerase
MENQKQNCVLVTGAQGFVGRVLTRLLERSGRRVIALDTRAENSSGEARATKVVCDIRHHEELESVFRRERIDEIVHLAAILPTAAQKDPVRATEVNVVGSLHLLEMARKFNVRRVVFGSSVSVYGTWPADRVVSEDDRATPEDVYGAAKLYVEQIGKAYADSHGMEFVSLRIGRVLGPGTQSKTSAWRSEIFELLGAQQPVHIPLPYTGSERVLVVHVEDVSAMLAKLLEAPRLAHLVYNAVCESVLVSDLKSQVEGLNRNITVWLGDGYALGNPRMLDSSLFQREFGFQTASVLEWLKRAAVPHELQS